MSRNAVEISRDVDEFVKKDIVPKFIEIVNILLRKQKQIADNSKDVDDITTFTRYLEKRLNLENDVVVEETNRYLEAITDSIKEMGKK